MEYSRMRFFVDLLLRHALIQVGMRLELEKKIENVHEKENL